MDKRLEKVRTVDSEISVKKEMLYSFLMVIFGVVLGVISKALDETAVNELPELFQYLDLTNFLGRFSIWIFIAFCISAYNNSAKRAALNVFLFFVGMVSRELIEFHFLLIADVLLMKNWIYFFLQILIAKSITHKMNLILQSKMVFTMTVRFTLMSCSRFVQLLSRRIKLRVSFRQKNTGWNIMRLNRISLLWKHKGKALMAQ